MSGERTHKIIGLCGQGKQAIKYPADVAKEKLLESCKPEYWNYIEKHLAGDFACEIVSQLSKVTEERDRAVNLIERLAQWKYAYPESVFTPVDLEAIAEREGVPIDCISAQVLRIATVGLSEEAEELLSFLTGNKS